MRVSKYIKVHRDILVEYIYDDNNNIGEGYKILTNVRNNTTSYVAGNGSITNNTDTNQLFRLDPVTNSWGLINTTNYSFLQLKDYASGFPVRHDTIKIHLPINYTFGEYLGCFIKVYGFDFHNQNVFELSNFFFDNTDVNQSYLLNFNAPPFLFNEKLWGKNLTIMIPSLDFISNQRVSGGARSNSINANLTGGLGMSQNSPIFIDFQFITTKRTINTVTTYLLNTRSTFTIPQTPEFENLGVVIEHSRNGDFFEIYGVYNGNISEFKTFMDNSVALGSRYYVEYQITLYEQNIRGKSFKIVLTDNFNEKVEYRPIIKYSTTTAVIDVEMRVIDAVDESSIYRRASYGMLQDEVAKYSLNLSKINIANASKPKIYNIKSPEGAGIFGNDRRLRSGGMNVPNTEIVLEPVKVNFAVLIDRFNVVAKSENAVLDSTTFYGDGKLLITLKPFDNVVKFIIAKNVSTDRRIVNNGANTTLENVTAPEYMDMTNMGEIKFVIKDDKQSFETGLYIQSNEIDLSRGVVVFKVPSSRMMDIKKIHDGGMNLFYITSKTESGTTVVYSSLFRIYDSVQNISSLNADQSNVPQEPAKITIIPPTITSPAIVKPKVVGTSQVTTSPTSTSTTQTSTSQGSTSTYNKIAKGGVVYEINPDSSLSIDGYNWTNTQLKDVLGLTEAPIRLKFKDVGLYSNDKYLSRLDDLKSNLEKKYIVTQEQTEIFQTTTQNNSTSTTSINAQPTQAAATPTVDLNNIAALSEQDFTSNLDFIANAYKNGTLVLSNQPPVPSERFTRIVTRAIQIGLNQGGTFSLNGGGGGSGGGAGGFQNQFTF